jgi:hypothetical protein
MTTEIAVVHNRDPNRNHAAALVTLFEQCREEICCVMPFVSNAGANVFLEALSRRAYKNDQPRIRFLLADDAASYLSGHLDLEALQRIAAQYPLEYRAYGDGLHAKLVIADRHTALVTSANLTGGGLRKNFELGVIIREHQLVEELCAEFDRAWRDAQELSAAEIDARRTWAKTHTLQISSVEFPFRKKIRWRPLATFGSRQAGGTDYFRGFEAADFERLDPRSYGGSFDDYPVNAEVVEKIQRAIAGPERDRLRQFYLAIKDYLPNVAHLYPHYAIRQRVKKFYPSATWLGLSRMPDRYVTLAQLAVGIAAEGERVGVFTNFNIGEEYQLNEDKGAFLKWVKSNGAEFLALLGDLDPGYSLRFHDGSQRISLSVRSVTQSDLDHVLQVPSEHLLNLEIERFVSWSDERSALSHSSIVLEVADQFQILHPIYCRAFTL